MILAVFTLWLREMIRFYRQPSRVVGALGSPFIFWLLIGSGIGSSFRGGDSQNMANYLEYFFPGTLLLVLLFTAIFSTISLIEDRKEGFMQGVLVAPVSRMTVVLGKILGGTTLAVLQGLLFCLMIPWLNIHLNLYSWLNLVGVLFINAFMMTGLGFLIAWQLESIQGFHAVMNLFLMPMWFLSGALFPGANAPAWMHALMKLNPMTYGLTSIRAAFYGSDYMSRHAAEFFTSLTMVFIFSAVIFMMAGFAVRRRNTDVIAG
ncbi:MAG: ABC transporter permease [Candidatus Omnitrophica bacterium]|nr:ABC transporter permease [Candidatus Omnitrophota bacterium]